jgi:hypothetical protein
MVSLGPTSIKSPSPVVREVSAKRSPGLVGRGISVNVRLKMDRLSKARGTGFNGVFAFTARRVVPLLSRRVMEYSMALKRFSRF